MSALAEKRKARVRVDDLCALWGCSPRSAMNRLRPLHEQGIVTLRREWGHGKPYRWIELELPEDVLKALRTL